MPERSDLQLLQVWQMHVMAEFLRKDADAAVAVMTDDVHVLLVPPLAGASGREEVRAFYARHFVPQIPPDMQPVPISQTIGRDRIVEESVYRFTHSLQMDWMLPGLAATGRPVEVAVVAVVGFRDGLIAHEHLYWDQASVLVQLGLLERSALPIHGNECSRRLLQLSRPG